MRVLDCADRHDQQSQEPTSVPAEWRLFVQVQSRGGVSNRRSQQVSLRSGGFLFKYSQGGGCPIAGANKCPCGVAAFVNVQSKRAQPYGAIIA